MKEPGSYGYLKIKNEADRAEVATILYKNGYTVRPARRKKNGKTYEYYVAYQISETDLGDGQDGC